MSFKDFALSGQQGDNALTRLALCFEAADPNSLISIWGSVAELTASHVRVAGLSKFTKLGDWVSVETDSGDQIGEAIRIETESILVRPLEDMHRPAIGARARLAQAIELRPEFDLERPCDRRARPPRRWRSPPCPRAAGHAPRQAPSLRLSPGAGKRAGLYRSSLHRPFHSALRWPTYRHFRGLRRRKIDAAVHALAREPLRYNGFRGHRGARARGQGVHRRHARRRHRQGNCGRLDERRKPDDAPSRGENRAGRRRIFPGRRRARASHLRFHYALRPGRA